MYLTFTPSELNELVKSATLENNGDDFENEFAKDILSNFPLYEDFWKIFVVPLTKRVEVKNKSLGSNIYFRDHIDTVLINIASAHYSMFVHLGYAHDHSKFPVKSSLENAYTHLATACDLAETVIIHWHFLLLECRGERSNVQNQYEVKGQKNKKRYDFRFDKGYRNDLLREYFGKAMKSKVNEYINFSKDLRRYRNIIVHDVLIGRIIGEKNQCYIPKLEKIMHYKNWLSVMEAAEDELKKKDFIEKDIQVKENVVELEKRLNGLWEKMVQEVYDELFSLDRYKLREMMKIKFSEKNQPADEVIKSKLFNAASDSGLDIFINSDQSLPEYRGGSIIFREVFFTQPKKPEE